MALTWKWSDKMGTMTIEQQLENEEKPRRYKVNIYDCNGLAVFLYEYKKDGKDMYSRHFFLSDKQHANRLKRNYGHVWPSSDKVVSVELDFNYKNAQKLAEILVDDGHKVTIYKSK